MSKNRGQFPPLRKTLLEFNALNQTLSQKTSNKTTQESQNKRRKLLVTDCKTVIFHLRQLKGLVQKQHE